MRRSQRRVLMVSVVLILVLALALVCFLWVEYQRDREALASLETKRQEQLRESGTGEEAPEKRAAGGGTSLVYEAAEYGEQTRVEAVYTDPEGNTWTQPLPATAPGRYETKLSTELTGVYHLNIRRTDDGEVTGV